MKQKFVQPSCENCQSRLSNIFCKLTEEESVTMSTQKSSAYYKKGQFVFFEGNSPGSLYCISKGKVKIYQTGNEGKEQILRLAKDGDIIGYRSLISGESYSASATAMEDSVICSIPKKTFFDLVQGNSGLSTGLMKLLSNDLKTAEGKITGLAQKPVRERLAETLLTLKEFYGVESDGQTIATNLTREDIANIVGSSTETTIRLLSELNNENVIDLSGKKIKINDLALLNKIANLQD